MKAIKDYQGPRRWGESMTNHKNKPQMNTDERGLETAKGQFLVYQAEDGKLKLDVRFEDESVQLG